jgi:hypothetical protein
MLMKVIDRSPKPEEGTGIDKLRDRLRKIMEFGLSWESDIQAQEVIITQMGKALSNKYILLRNVQLEGLDIPIPLILVGPQGLFVMYTSALKGVYRAKGETWAEMHSRTRRFEPARPNLITRTLLMTRAVETFLARRGHHILEIQSVLLFSNPGTHVDIIRPAIRVVLMDGLDRFISGLAQTRTFLTGEDIQHIVDAILQPASSQVSGEAEALAQPTSGAQSTAPREGGALPTHLSRNYVTLSNRINLTRGQWIFLGLFAFIQVIIVAAFIIYVLLTT